MTSKDRAELETLQRALQQDATDVRSRLKLADLHLRTGQLDDAVTEYFRCANEYAANGFYLKAAAVCRQILNSRPDHAPSFRFLSELYSGLGLATEAVEIVRTYVQVLVMPLVRDGQTGEAMERLRALGDLHACHYDAQAIALAAMTEIDPNDPAVLRPFAAALLAGGRATEAATVAERALRANPDDLEVMETLALAFLQVGERERARAAIEHLIAACERIGHQPRLAAARKLLEKLSAA